MPRVLIPRTRAKSHTAVKDDTLLSIFEANVEPSGITWDEFVGYNFGTSDTRALNRAIVELLGACAIDEGDARRSTIDPAKKPESARFDLKIPELYAASELEVRKEHVVKLRRRAAPPAVAFTSLDPWFIPKKETCRIAYTLDGDPESADKLTLAVYASAYCKARVEANGAVHFTAAPELAGHAVFEHALKDPKPRADKYAFDEWDGTTTATEGVLKARKSRTVNVASSPYTVMLRYYKDDADKDARVLLEPFWPAFAPDTGDAKAESLVVSWKIEGGDRLAHGQLRVIDRDGAVVLLRGLGKSEIAAGKFDWAEGAPLVKRDKMPYRAALELHTEDGDDKGLALAAMHTEVRLWVAPAVKRDLDPENWLKDPQCMDLRLAPVAPASEQKPVRGSDAWCAQRLATLGHHPGPVNAAPTTATFKRAIRDFQRSYPKKVRVRSEYARLAVNGTLDADTKEMLDHPLTQTRPIFGEIKDDDFEVGDLALDVAGARVGDKDDARGLVVWVDDQHYYTHGTLPVGTDPNMGLGDYRGAMDLVDDGKVTRDAESIPRPWIPLSVRPRVLSREHGLARDTAPDWDDAMAGCIGPLRVDWAFMEAKPALQIVEKMQAKLGVSAAVENKKRVRTLAFLKYRLSRLGYRGDHNEGYVNCPVACGGLRPDKKDDLAGYQKSLFGLEDESLRPWRALDDSAVERVVALVHDDLGQDDQALHADAVGKSGVYFRPSIMAGDGYRVRAEVRFTKAPGDADHPNREALAARYPQTPVVHSSRLQVWRKSSVRGHVSFTPKPNEKWVETARKAAYHYRASNVHFVHARGAAKHWSAAELVEVTSDHYKDTILATLQRAPYNTKAHLGTHREYAWPWAASKHFGIVEIPDDAVAIADFRDKFLEDVFKYTWDKCREAILLRLLESVEKKNGRMRGHLAVAFGSTPKYRIQVYYCSAAAKHRNVLIERENKEDSATGDGCHVTACAGVLSPGYVNSYDCPACHTQILNRDEAVPNSNPTCDQLCPGIKNPSPARVARGPVQVTYTCNTCGAQDIEPAAYHVAAYGCGNPCGGHGNPTALVQTASAKSIHPGLNAGLPLPAVGGPLGVGFVFEGDDLANWAHEIGHHRHMEHAASAPGAKTAQHDSQPNPNITDPATKVEDRNWDSACVMGYGDKLFFCGKCVLKNRGWKVEGIALPPSGEEGF